MWVSYFYLFLRAWSIIRWHETVTSRTGVASPMPTRICGTTVLAVREQILYQVHSELGCGENTWFLCPCLPRGTKHLCPWYAGLRRFYPT